MVNHFRCRLHFRLPGFPPAIAVAVMKDPFLHAGNKYNRKNRTTQHPEFSSCHVPAGPVT